MALPSLIVAGAKMVGKTLLSHAAGNAARKALETKTPKPPKPPTLDSASQARQESDRIRRRRGALANVSAGEAAAPSIGTRALLGG
jgi:DNA-binding IclR family transcriptional regulator